MCHAESVHILQFVASWLWNIDIHHKLVDFADIVLLVSEAAGGDEALYQFTLLLGNNTKKKVASRWSSQKA